LTGCISKFITKLIVQVNKEDRVVFFLVWNLFPWQSKRRLDHHHLVIRSELPATVQYRYLSDDSRINSRTVLTRMPRFFVSWLHPEYVTARHHITPDQPI